jgi:hypothetical protein
VQECDLTLVIFAGPHSLGLVPLVPWSLGPPVHFYPPRWESSKLATPHPGSLLDSPPATQGSPSDKTVSRPASLIQHPHTNHYAVAAFSNNQNRSALPFPVILHIHESPEATLVCPRLRIHFPTCAALQPPFPSSIRPSGYIPPPFKRMSPYTLLGLSRGLRTKSSSHATSVARSRFLKSAEPCFDI